MGSTHICHVWNPSNCNRANVLVHFLYKVKIKISMQWCNETQSWMHIFDVVKWHAGEYSKNIFLVHINDQFSFSFQKSLPHMLVSMATHYKSRNYTCSDNGTSASAPRIATFPAITLASVSRMILYKHKLKVI